MFAHPAMLAGLSAVAVPVLIHLLSRRRHVDVAWAAMRFLRVADARHRRRLRAEDVLLLLLRCVTVALLAVAAAGPLLGPAASAGRGGVTAVLVVDDSATMAGTDGVASRADRARRAAGELLDGLPTGSSVAVLMASDTVAPLVASPTRDLSLVRKLIADAPPTGRASDLLPAVRAAVELLRTVQGPREIDVLTDGQRTALARSTEIAAALRAAPYVSARFVLVGPDVRSNVGVSALRPAGDLTPTGRPVRFEATVTNYGAEPVRDLPVRLSVDADAPSAEATVPEVPAGASRTVALYARLPTAGPHAVTATVPPDRMPADDRRTIIVRGQGKLHVLLVVGEHGGPAASFLRAALQPVAADQRADYFVQVATAAPAELATASLSDVACVVVAGSPPLDAAAANAVASYVDAGGGLIVFPDAAIDGPFAALLPAAVGPPTGDAARPVHLSAGPFEHPLAAVWNDPANGSPAAAQVFRASTLTPADAARVVLPMADGRPFAVERPTGRGRAIVFAVAADTDASDLPDRGGLFVPLLYRCLAAVVDRRDESLNGPVGRPLLGTAGVTDVGRAVTVRPPDGASPGTTTVTLTDGRAGFRYDATDRAGAYAATVNGATTRYAAQADPAESSLESVTAADRATLSAVATVTDGRIPPAAAGRSAATLSLPLLLAGLALAAVEPVAANFASRPR